MTDTTNPGWPDPSRPGVPLHPERDGWHWLVPSINHALPPGSYRWHAPPRSDVIGQWDAGYPQDVVRRGYDYLGPCLTPAEHAAALAAQATAMREQIAGWISEVRDYCIRQRDAAQDKAAEELFDALARDRKGILDGIALMPLPSTFALAAMLAEARREGMREAAGLGGVHAAAYRETMRDEKSNASQRGMAERMAAACDDLAAAILAAAIEKETKA
jgi:hypothetical protein